MLFRATVLIDLWEWFVSPFLHLEAPTLIQALGLMLIVAFLFKNEVPNEEKAVKSSFSAILDKTISAGVTSVLLTLMFWVMGWVIQFWMV